MSALDDWATETPLDELAQRRKDVAQARTSLDPAPAPAPRVTPGIWAALAACAVVFTFFWVGIACTAVYAWHHPAGAAQLLFALALPPVGLLGVHLGNRRLG